ncbi:MAG TPA: hypothetical protein VHN79_10755 [Lacunisphaera sp.]|nr:hypothetical protein [Lacunisphaera sp.]
MNDNVDYAAPADLFPAPRHRKRPLRYRRFDTLAEAVRFALEELPADERDGALIEADEIRYTGVEIVALYQAAGYPLPRPQLSH